MGFLRWVDHEDAAILDLYAHGRSARYIARCIPGRSRSSVIARLARLRGVGFRSEADRENVRKDFVAARAANTVIGLADMRAMLGRLRKGASPAAAYRIAWAAGATQKQIAYEVGLSAVSVCRVMSNALPKPRDGNGRGDDNREGSAAGRHS